MSTIIEKATKGNRAAMNQLLEANKNQIYGLCLALLGSKPEATSGTVQAFRQLWEQLLDGKLDSEEAVKTCLVRRAVNYCKNRLQRKDSKAFRVPANKDFSAITCNRAAIRPDSNTAEQILASLPPLHRTISVLTGGLGLSAEETGGLVGLSPELVELALAAEEGNLSRGLSARNQRLGEDLSLSLEQFHTLLREQIQRCTLPNDADTALQSGLNAIVQPLEQKTSKRAVLILGTVAACLLVVILVVAIRGLSGNHTTFTSGNNTSANGNTGTQQELPVGDPVSVNYTTELQSITCYADIAIQNYGIITVALDGASAPETVANFITLAESGFYDGLTFHRIMDGFMMQGGDPNGNGTGGSETNILGEFASNGIANPLSHVAGAISMARSARPNSASSQFFIVHEDSTFLDGDYAVFGYVTEGMDIVDAICSSAQPMDNNGAIAPDAQPIIDHITIRTAEQSTADNGGSTTIVSSGDTSSISIEPINGQTGTDDENIITEETWNVSQDLTEQTSTPLDNEETESTGD